MLTYPEILNGGGLESRCRRSRDQDVEGLDGVGGGEGFPHPHLGEV